NFCLVVNSVTSLPMVYTKPECGSGVQVHSIHLPALDLMMYLLVKFTKDSHCANVFITCTVLFLSSGCTNSIKPLLIICSSFHPSFFEKAGFNFTSFPSNEKTPNKSFEVS